MYNIVFTAHLKNNEVKIRTLPYIRIHAKMVDGHDKVGNYITLDDNNSCLLQEFGKRIYEFEVLLKNYV